MIVDYYYYLWKSLFKFFHLHVMNLTKDGRILQRSVLHFLRFRDQLVPPMPLKEFWTIYE